MLYVFVRYLRLFLKEFCILPDLVCSHQREMKRVDDCHIQYTKMEIAPCSAAAGGDSAIHGDAYFRRSSTAVNTPAA
jgi:hypothetical protein